MSSLTGPQPPPPSPPTLFPSPCAAPLSTSTASSSPSTIMTRRLLLRAAQLSDGPALHAIFSDATVMRYWSTRPHSTLTQTTHWLAKMVDSEQNGATEFVMCLLPPPPPPTDDVVRTAPAPAPAAITAVQALGGGGAAAATSSSSSPSQVIGKIGIWRDTEIGFLLHSAYWRRGLMWEAMEALLPYYFESVLDGGRGLKAVTADTDPRNAATLALLRALGFVVTGQQSATWWVGEYEEGVDVDGLKVDASQGHGRGEWVDSVYLELRSEEWMNRQRQWKTGEKGRKEGKNLNGIRWRV